MCRKYNTEQGTCLDSVKARAMVTSIIGTIGIVLFPLVFWYITTSWIAMIFPIVLGIVMQTYYILPECKFYSMQRLAPFAIAVTAFLLVIQLIFFGINLRVLNAEQFERYALARNGGDSDGVAYRKAKSPSPL
jgi:hypothetical protein